MRDVEVAEDKQKMRKQTPGGGRLSPDSFRVCRWSHRHAQGRKKETLTEERMDCLYRWIEAFSQVLLLVM